MATITTMANPTTEPVTVSEVTSGDYEGTIFVGDDMESGKLITESGGDLDVMFVLVSGYLARFPAFQRLYSATECFRIVLIKLESLEAGS